MPNKCFRNLIALPLFSLAYISRLRKKCIVCCNNIICVATIHIHYIISQCEIFLSCFCFHLSFAFSFACVCARVISFTYTGIVAGCCRFSSFYVYMLFVSTDSSLLHVLASRGKSHRFEIGELDNYDINCFVHTYIFISIQMKTELNRDDCDKMAETNAWYIWTDLLYPQFG